MLIYGINPVIEALRAGRVVSLSVCESSNARLRTIVSLADSKGTPVRRLSRAELSRAAAGRSHQGVIADVTAPRAVSVQELVRAASAVPLVVVLDGIEDPQNFGAILRTADAAGVDGVIHQTRRTARLGAAVTKASAGALAHMRIASVVNIARALEELKAVGVWTVGLTGDASRSYGDVDLTVPTAVVVGAEGRGLRRLVRERCDWLVAIPMAGHVESLNVSVATGIALFEAVRQRTRGAARPGG